MRQSRMQQLRSRHQQSQSHLCHLRALVFGGRLHQVHPLGFTGHQAVLTGAAGASSAGAARCTAVRGRATERAPGLCDRSLTTFSNLVLARIWHGRYVDSFVESSNSSATGTSGADLWSWLASPGSSRRPFTPSILRRFEPSASTLAG